jgi:hypothetical protein
MTAKNDLIIYRALMDGVIDINMGIGKVFRLINNGYRWTDKNIYKPREKRLFISRGEYYAFNLFFQGRGYTVYLHRAIWIKLHGVPDSKMQINHIDGNKLNNNINNLELVTPSGNQKHAVSIGLIKSGMRAVPLETAKEIQSKYVYRKNGGIHVLAKEYVISYSVIHKIVRNKYNNIPTKCLEPNHDNRKAKWLEVKG